MMNITYKDNRYIKTGYKSVVYLALLYHIIFACLIAGFHFPTVFFYHFCVCIFYFLMLGLLKKKAYQLVTVLVHIEIISFVTANTILFGWDAGFHAYLVALASLVYFNPFEKKKIMYGFSAVEAIWFFGLKVVTLYVPSVLHSDTRMLEIFYLLNFAGCFIVVVCGAVVSKVSADTTEKRLEKKTRFLQNQADHDTLTHLWTRSYLMKQYHYVEEKGVPFSIVMCDIDNFKKINDTYGHNCGDYILENIAKIIQDNSPENAIVTRWGGEEFIILLEDCDITKGRPLVEKLRQKVADGDFSYEGNTIRVTMTFGISTSMEQTEMIKLIELADARMYVGKQNGKNRVVDDSYELK